MEVLTYFWGRFGVMREEVLLVSEVYENILCGCMEMKCVEVKCIELRIEA
jgi:hypothetical protein